MIKYKNENCYHIYNLRNVNINENNFQLKLSKKIDNPMLPKKYIIDYF